MPNPRTAAEWATVCKVSEHYIAHTLGPGNLLCLDCADAYARQQVREALENQAAWSCPLCHCCGEKRHDGGDPCVACTVTRNEVLEPALKALREIATMRWTIDGKRGEKNEATFVAEEAIAALREGK